MPFCEIPADKLNNINLFGYDVISDNGGPFLWVHGPRGRLRVERSRPRLWFEDIADAMQIGAIAILQTK